MTMDNYRYRLPLKERMERMIQRRRDRDQYREETWANTSKYFHNWETQTNKFNEWTSNKYYEDSLKSYHDYLEKDEKRKSLERRREALKELLQKEEAELKGELDEIEKEYRSVSKQRSKKKIADSAEQIEYLKKHTEELHRRKEEERKKEVALKDFLRWKANNPAIRDLESRQHTQFVKKAWEDQVEEKVNRDKMAKEQNLKIEEDLAKHREQELQKILDAQEEKKKEIEYWKAEISRQTHELKLRAEMTKKLEQQLNDITKQKSLLDETIEARELFNKDREQSRLLVKFWGKQTRLKLRAQCKERLDSIAQDKLTLEYLKRLDDKRAEDSKNANIGVSAKIEAVRECLEKHRKVEIEREKEYTSLFEEEARSFLKQQEAVWENERRMRENLMQDVIQTLEKQIQEKIEANKKKQDLIEAEKARILLEIEERDKQIRDEEAALHQKMDEWKAQLTQQIYEKRKQKEKEMLESLDMLSRMKFEEDREKNFLNHEENKLQINGYKPKFHGFKKVAW